ncbi:MAG TPA: NYN domain-containing protein, partial [Rhodocyclaceae bacterium]|nr:NYN domain-containing protein [Rhodocyclaceae bacterium]
MGEKKRVMAFVDGFNLYHAIDDLDIDPKSHRPRRQKQHLKWLNIWSMASAFAPPSRETIVAVHYFSAFATWLPDAHQRHREYVRALEATGVHVVMGNFKKKFRSCNSCKTTWTGHEEKESDVNIALHLLDMAYQDAYDKAFLVTADTDLVPAIKMVRSRFPEKEVVALIPKNRFQHAMELRQACNSASRIEESHIEKNLFDSSITL